MAQGMGRVSTRAKSNLGNYYFHGRESTRQVLRGIIYADSSELYNLLLVALSVASPSEANGLVMKAIRTGISLPQIFDLQQLISLSSVQQLQKENNPAYDLLQIFLAGDLETYRTFIKSHPSWLADNRTPFQYGELTIRHRSI